MEGRKEESWPGQPDPCLSVAMRYFFPDDTVYNQLDRYRDHHLVSRFNSDSEIVKICTTGSLAENLNLPGVTNFSGNYIRKADVDMMWCFIYISRFLLAEGYKTHSSLRPGYCYIKVNSELLRFSGKSAVSKMRHALAYMFKGHIFPWNNNLYIKNSFYDIMFKHYNEGREERGKRRPSQCNGIDFLFMQAGSMDITEARPAVTCSTSARGEHPLSYDYVSCFQVPWPVDANEWQERKRNNGYPSPGLIKSIVSGGCHVVCKQNKHSQYSHIEWRYSFSIAEVSLARTLLPMQRICYRVFKALVKRQGENRALKIQSYLMKTTFFWFCEESPKPAWTLNNLGKLFLCLLDKFLEFLHAHNLPQYFIRESNLIENHSEKDIKQLIRCVKYIRGHPISCMEEYYSEYVPYDRTLWSNNPRYMCIKYIRILQNRLRILRDRQPNTVDTIRAIKTSLKNTGFYFAFQGHHEMMLSVAQTLCNSIQDFRKYQAILTESDPKDMYDELRQLKNQYLYYIDWKDNPFSGKKESMESILAVLRAELACICYQMSTMNSSKEDVDQLLKEVMNHINIAFSYTNCSWTVRLKCHLLLVVMGRYDKPFDGILKPFHLQLCCDNFVAYSRYTNQCVDQTLRIFNIIDHSETHYYAFALEYYLLHVYCKELEIDPAMYGLPKIQDLLDNIGFETLSEWDWLYQVIILLEGCFLLRYGHFHKALFCFMQTVPPFYEYGVYIWYCVASLFCFYHAQL